MLGHFGRLWVTPLGGAIACFALSADVRACATTDAGPTAKAPSLIHPAPGKIFETFGPRFHPLLNGRRQHNGFDYLANTGDPIHAAASGEVTFAGDLGAHGRAIEIKHDAGWATFYAHLSRPAVRTGDCVKAGDVIGASGNTGLSTGPHLHFEIRRDGNPIDPETLLDITGRKCVLDCPSDPDRPCTCEPSK